jgi:hypothetical protein
MTDITPPPLTWDLDAAIEIVTAPTDGSAARCMAHCRHGSFEAWAWMDFAVEDPGVIHPGKATIMPLGPTGGTAVVVAFQEAATPCIGELVPTTFCPLPGVIEQTADLIASLDILPLRHFVTRALLSPAAFRRFWSCPASRYYHHAFAGGLALHSLEVAVPVAVSPKLPRFERELGIVYALLHDYGKLWWLEPDLFDPQERRGHEALGRAKLGPVLAALAEADTGLAAVMTELLGGPPAPRQSPYPLAIKKIVHAFDQMSCEAPKRLFHEVRLSYLDEPTR